MVYMVKENGKGKQSEKKCVILPLPNSSSLNLRIDRMQGRQLILSSTEFPPFVTSFNTNVYLS